MRWKKHRSLLDVVFGWVRMEGKREARMSHEMALGGHLDIGTGMILLLRNALELKERYIWFSCPRCKTSPWKATNTHESWTSYTWETAQVLFVYTDWLTACHIAQSGIFLGSLNRLRLWFSTTFAGSWSLHCMIGMFTCQKVPMSGNRNSRTSFKTGSSPVLVRGTASTKLKNFYSFKKRYSVSSMGFIGSNKRFLWAAVGVPGWTHDSRLLKSCSLYNEIQNKQVFSNATVDLQEHGKIPFTTVGDCFSETAMAYKAIQSKH